MHTIGRGHVQVLHTLWVLLAGASAFLILRYRVNSVWLVLGGVGVGLLLSQIMRLENGFLR